LAKAASRLSVSRIDPLDRRDQAVEVGRAGEAVVALLDQGHDHARLGPRAEGRRARGGLLDFANGRSSPGGRAPKHWRRPRGHVAYVRAMRSEEVKRLFPEAPDLTPGLDLFALLWCRT
jgi:hypothetical protein